MAKGSGKGSQFERDICRKLSLWWTDGQRDDVFWRTSGSGAQATVRGRRGKATYGQYGDIHAVDPIGEPLLRVFTFELKKGYNQCCPSNHIETISPFNTKKPPILRQFINQAEDSDWKADSLAWAIIHRRDHRHIMLMTPFPGDWTTLPWLEVFKKLDYILMRSDQRMVIQVRLDDFLAACPAKKFRQYMETLDL
jgi:hypothetical protein